MKLIVCQAGYGVHSPADTPVASQQSLMRSARSIRQHNRLGLEGLGITLPDCPLGAVILSDRTLCSRCEVASMALVTDQRDVDEINSHSGTLHTKNIYFRSGASISRSVNRAKGMRAKRKTRCKEDDRGKADANGFRISSRHRLRTCRWTCSSRS